MTDKMKRFLELVSGNEALAAKFNGASRDEVIAIAKEAGFTLTDADFEAPQNGEISDDDLDAVAGGRLCCTCFGEEAMIKNGDCTCEYSGTGTKYGVVSVWECISGGIASSNYEKR